jgi:hypothetical protein
MKLAVLSESPADEAAIRILANGIIGQETEAVELDMFGISERLDQRVPNRFPRAPPLAFPDRRPSTGC